MPRGSDSLAAQVQTHLPVSPFSGDLYVFRGRRCDRVKCLWFDGARVRLFYRRLESTHFASLQMATGTVMLSPAQLSMLLEGLEWRRSAELAFASRRIAAGRRGPNRNHLLLPPWRLLEQSKAAVH